MLGTVKTLKRDIKIFVKELNEKLKNNVIEIIINMPQENVTIET
jgi:hypothetical protein